MTTRRSLQSDHPRHVAIVGSRHLSDYRSFCTTIRPLLRPSDVLVSGDADGIDSLTERFAHQNKHPFVCHPVSESAIDAHVSAGMDRRAAFARAANDRNQHIVDDADTVFAVLCEHSRGTLDTIARARRKFGIDDHNTRDLRLVIWLWDCPRA